MATIIILKVSIMNNLNKKIDLPDAQNIFAVKQFRNMYGDDLYMNMVEKNDSMKMHPGQRRIKKKKIEIVEVNDINMTIAAADDLNDGNQHNDNDECLSSDYIFLDDQQQQAYNDGLLVEDLKDVVEDDEVILEEDNDNYLSSNDDVDDDWCNRTEEEYEDRIIYQAHGGGGCFEDGTADDVNDQQEEDIVKSYYSNSFNILEDVCLKIAFKIKCRAEGIFHKNGLDVQDLYPNSSATVKDCSLLLRNFTSRHKLSEQGELSLVLLLKKILPSNAKLPLHQTKNGSYVSDIDKVLEEDNLISGVKTFDICPLLGCTVFVGNDEFKFQCPSCGTNRYTNCAQCTRNKKPMMVNGNNNRCQHSGRLAKKQLSYKCILPTILKAVLQPCFLQLINFKCYNYTNGNNHNEYICDIGNSIAYKEGMEEMKKQFNELKLKQSIVNNVIISDKTIPVPLLLSIFYDGVQMFSTKQNIPYSPLFLTILNLPPLIRSIIGLGKFFVLFFFI